MFERIQRWWTALRPDEAELQRRRAELLARAPVPTLWLFGKTGSGKSSVIRFLTGAESAEIGSGFRPCTQTSSQYDFPDSREPLVTFLDTRGLGEVNYDPTDDLARFDASAQLLLVTARITDHALDDVLGPLRRMRQLAPQRPVLLALTCLHQAVPGTDLTEHDPFPDDVRTVPETLPAPLRQLLQTQLERFAGLVDLIVPIDLTPAAEGFSNPEFGGERLQRGILQLLPAAYRQGLLTLQAELAPLKSLQQRQAQVAILSASSLAAAAAAVPVPWLDIPVVFAIQHDLAKRLAKQYSIVMTDEHRLRLNAIAGGRVAVQMALRELLKAIPWVGMAANAAAAFAYTYAMGATWNWYLLEVQQGAVPGVEAVQQAFAEQLTRGAKLWQKEAIQ